MTQLKPVIQNEKNNKLFDRDCPQNISARESQYLLFFDKHLFIRSDICDWILNLYFLCNLNVT